MQAQSKKYDSVASHCLQAFLSDKQRNDDDYAAGLVGGMLIAEAFRELRHIRRLLTPKDK